MASRFEHRRPEDNEHVGYIELNDDGLFVPFNLLQQPTGEPMELDEAEELLNAAGLKNLAEEWILTNEDGSTTRVRIQEVTQDSVVVAPALDSETVAKALDLTKSIELQLPTDRLQPST